MTRPRPSVAPNRRVLRIHSKNGLGDLCELLCLEVARVTCFIGRSLAALVGDGGVEPQRLTQLQKASFIPRQVWRKHQGDGGREGSASVADVGTYPNEYPNGRPDRSSSSRSPYQSTCGFRLRADSRRVLVSPLPTPVKAPNGLPCRGSGFTSRLTSSSDQMLYMLYPSSTNRTVGSGSSRCSVRLARRAARHQMLEVSVEPAQTARP